MNLHGIVRGAITAVNPDLTVTLKRSLGSTTAASGKRTPTYETMIAPVQVQAASGKDVERVNNMGVQGVMRSVHLNGYWRGIVRADAVGGDLLLFPEYPGGIIREWRVTSVAETWADWSRVIVVLQAKVTP